MTRANRIPLFMWLALSGAAVATEPPTPAEAPKAAADPAASAADWMARADELYKTRDLPASQRELNRIFKLQLSRDPNDFEVNWRLAQLLAYQANGMPDGSDVKAAVGKAAWEAGDRAAAARGDDVRGQYWAAVGIGLYSEGVGILTALSEGLEGKFRSRAQAALRIDKDYLDGGPQVLWGRYFYKLPWPKRDLDEAVRVLSAAAKEHPRNLRLKLFLADALADSDRKEEARKLQKEVLDAPLSDPPDDRRNKEWAKQRNY
ncbi:MAG TPA: tetratricopeptide repeat protein [Myxococcales bacterium]|jgi:hypothetical protein|nr:tetratricopeptide repeat protein [Myxococcales bacterium]